MQLQEKTSELEEESNADEKAESQTNINIENEANYDCDKEQSCLSSEELPPQKKVRRIKRLRYY